MTRNRLRVALLVTVLAAAAAVALWPSMGPSMWPSMGPSMGPSDPGTPPVVAAPPAPDMDALRARAALAPCPEPVGDAAPAGPLAGVTVPCLGAPGSVDLGTALAGRPALLNLWGPLCGPCREEMPALAGYAASPGAIPVIGVEVQRLPAGGLDLLAALDVHYPSVSDPDGALRRALGSPPVLPLTYVVAPDGRVMQVNPPEVFRDPAGVRAAVERYLGHRAVG
ncbi:MAG: redoxin family protein [Pseudonocardiaceae bacterium]|nr:redoxin family protein [Pseudonocardiaceae bacterium]